MKKILVVSLTFVTLCIVSCTKNCTCTESKSGYTTDAGKKTSSECSDYQRELQRTANSYNYKQSWHCVSE